MGVEKYPLDFDILEKGNWLEGSELEHAIGSTPADPTHWRLGLLKLKQQIEDQTPILCREDHDRIRLMTDPEAREHTRRRWFHNLGGMVKQVTRRARIDVTLIPSDEKQMMESETRMMAAVTLAARSELRKQKRIELLVGDRPAIQ